MEQALDAVSSKTAVGRQGQRGIIRRRLSIAPLPQTRAQFITVVQPAHEHEANLSAGGRCNQRWVIGLASGSSADGIDAALLDLDGVGLEVHVRQLHYLHQPYPAELRDLIRQVAGAVQADTGHVARLHRLLGETFAGAARAVADHASPQPR